MKDLFVFTVMVYIGLFFDNMNIFRYCMLSCILHEIGHILAYRVCIKKWPKIKISVLGFCMENNVTDSQKLFYILICGPLFNLIAVIISVISINFTLTLNKLIFTIINLIIFIFNILPVYYLDGGQILYCFSPFYQRNYITISIFIVFLAGVMVVSFTEISAFYLLAIAYFIYNILNDI